MPSNRNHDRSTNNERCTTFLGLYLKGFWFQETKSPEEGKRKVPPEESEGTMAQQGQEEGSADGRKQMFDDVDSSAAEMTLATTAADGTASAPAAANDAASDMNSAPLSEAPRATGTGRRRQGVTAARLKREKIRKRRQEAAARMRAVRARVTADRRKWAQRQAVADREIDEDAAAYARGAHYHRERSEETARHPPEDAADPTPAAPSSSATVPSSVPKPNAKTQGTESAAAEDAGAADAVATNEVATVSADGHPLRMSADRDSPIDDDRFIPTGVLVGHRILRSYGESTGGCIVLSAPGGEETEVPSALFMGTVVEYRPPKSLEDLRLQREARAAAAAAASTSEAAGVKDPGTNQEHDDGSKARNGRGGGRTARRKRKRGRAKRGLGAVRPLDYALYRILFDDGDVADLDPREVYQCSLLYDAKVKHIVLLLFAGVFLYGCLSCVLNMSANQPNTSIYPHLTARVSAQTYWSRPSQGTSHHGERTRQAHSARQP